MDYFVIIVVFGLMIWGVVMFIYNNTSHSKTNGKILKEDALICDIKTENIGGRKMSNAAIRTTVKFDDGFIYISHKSQIRMDKPLFLSGTIYVDRSVIEMIKEDAIEAHKKAYDKQLAQNLDSSSFMDKKTTISFCRKCGNKVTEDSVFCNKCGSKINWN